MKQIMDILSGEGGGFGIVVSLLALAFWVVRKITTIQAHHDSFSKNVDSITKNIDEIRKDHSYMRGRLDLLDDKTKALVQSNSPLSLNKKGEEVAKQLGIREKIEANWTKIDSYIKTNTEAQTPYDIQQLCIQVASVQLDVFFEESEVKEIKDAAYNEGMNMVLYGTMIGVLIRDKYLKKKHIPIDEVDKSDPNKTIEPSR